MEKLSEIEGMKVPQYSSEEIRERLSKDDLWDFIVNLYSDAVKKESLSKNLKEEDKV